MNRDDVKQGTHCQLKKLRQGDEFYRNDTHFKLTGWDQQTAEGLCTDLDRNKPSIPISRNAEVETVESYRARKEVDNATAKRLAKQREADRKATEDAEDAAAAKKAKARGAAAKAPTRVDPVVTPIAVPSRVLEDDGPAPAPKPKAAAKKKPAAKRAK